MPDKYRVIKRLTFDDVKIFEVGEIIPLDQDQAAKAMEFNAVEPVADEAPDETPENAEPPEAPEQEG